MVRLLSKIFFRIAMILVCFYHLCFFDTWRGMYFGLKHRNHSGIGIERYQNGQEGAYCKECGDRIKFRQKTKVNGSEL